MIFKDPSIAKSDAIYLFMCHGGFPRTNLMLNILIILFLKLQTVVLLNIFFLPGQSRLRTMAKTPVPFLKNQFHADKYFKGTQD